MSCIVGDVTLDPSSDQYQGSGLAWRIFRQISYHLNHDRTALREQGPTLAAQAKGLATIICEFSDGAELPIGTVITMATNDDPNTAMGYGSWTKIADGRVLVGQDTGDTDFDVLEETGGVKQHNHYVEAHEHGMADHTHALSHTHDHDHQHAIPIGYESPNNIYLLDTTASSTQNVPVAKWQSTSGGEDPQYWLLSEGLSGGDETTGAPSTANTGAADPDTTDEGGGDNTDEAQNLMPYYVVTFWKRVA